MSIATPHATTNRREVVCSQFRWGRGVGDRLVSPSAWSGATGTTCGTRAPRSQTSARWACR